MESLTRAQQELYDWLVEYIETTQHAPSIRQMMRAMNLRSPAPIQSRLERLRNKGYIDWTDGKARTLRILHHKPKGVPVLGELVAGEVEEILETEVTKLDLGQIIKQPNAFALRVMGDNLTDNLIAGGDILVLRPVSGDEIIPDGELVAIRVEGEGVTLKSYTEVGDKVILKPLKGKGEPMELKISDVEIQGILIGVWRGQQTVPMEE
ncbi:MAG: transcriptional repressor LexA [Cyanobacteriota bacterium]|nr:transcriptional repressor LexA [Cyanobacteriota bacterium]